MHEALLHELDLGASLVVLRDGGAAMASLCQPRLEWAISVIYRPETERLSHYFHPLARAICQTSQTVSGALPSRNEQYRPVVKTPK